MSFIDQKLLKLYNKRPPKELMSLKTVDIKGATVSKQTFTRADDAEEKYLKSSLYNFDEEKEALSEVNRRKNVDHFARVMSRVPEVLDKYDRIVAESSYKRDRGMYEREHSPQKRDPQDMVTSNSEYGDFKKKRQVSNYDENRMPVGMGERKQQQMDTGYDQYTRREPVVPQGMKDSSKNVRFFESQQLEQGINGPQMSQDPMQQQNDSQRRGMQVSQSVPQLGLNDSTYKEHYREGSVEEDLRYGDSRRMQNQSKRLDSAPRSSRERKEVKKYYTDKGMWNPYITQNKGATNNKDFIYKHIDRAKSGQVRGQAGRDQGQGQNGYQQHSGRMGAGQHYDESQVENRSVLPDNQGRSQNVYQARLEDYPVDAQFLFIQDFYDSNIRKLKLAEARRRGSKNLLKDYIIRSDINIPYRQHMPEYDYAPYHAKEEKVEFLERFNEREKEYQKQLHKSSKSNTSRDNTLAVKIPYNQNRVDHSQEGRMRPVDLVKNEFDRLEQSDNRSVVSPQTDTSSYYERSFPREPRDMRHHKDSMHSQQSISSRSGYQNGRQDDLLVSQRQSQMAQDPEFMLNSNNFY